jgi:hypothetical protein
VTLLATGQARAYVYAGDWVADCPRACGNVEHLFDRANPRDLSSARTARKPVYHCSYCQYFTGDIEWPADAEEIVAALSVRPIPHTRNWYPSDHEVAVRAGIPHGQSVADLVDENHDHGVM